MDRLLFDAVLSAKAVERARIAAGDEDGISAAARAQYAQDQVDDTEYDELEQLKEKMRQDGRPG